MSDTGKNEPEFIPPLPLENTFYHEVGGMETFEALVRAFYEGVREDPVLWPMYPADDLEGAIERLTLFLAQYWGGPPTYSERRGHPRLRLRHQAFKVNPEARDHWLMHMMEAMDTVGIAPLHRATLEHYFDRAAHALVNTFEP